MINVPNCVLHPDKKKPFCLWRVPPISSLYFDRFSRSNNIKCNKLTNISNSNNTSKDIRKIVTTTNKASKTNKPILKQKDGGSKLLLS